MLKVQSDLNQKENLQEFFIDIFEQINNKEILNKD